MRLFLVIAFLALVASVFAGGTSTCRSGQQNGRNNFDIVQAINNFCGPTWDLVNQQPFSIKQQIMLRLSLANTTP